MTDPIITFFKLIPGAPAPARADPTLLGSIPLRAHRFCEPFIAASGFGWHIFPPINFSLMWDGTSILWRPSNEQRWRVLENAAVPGYPEHYKEMAPKDRDVPNPFPFLIAIQEPGIIQVWTGCLARTREDWVTLIRAPANLPGKQGYEILEGIVETDWWLGPLFANIRLYQTGYPIQFRTQRPLFQVQAVPRIALDEEVLESMEVVEGLDKLAPEDWSGLAEAVHLRSGPEARIGDYRREVRRRRKARET